MSQRRFNDNKKFNRRPRDENREMHDTKCSDCGNDTQVPFKPDGERPVYCKDCFSKRRPARNDY